MPADFGSNILASSIVFLVFLIVAGLVFFFLNWKRMHKQKGYYENIHRTLNVGQRVMFSDGLFGTLVHVRKESCDIKIAPDVVIEVSRFAIQEILDGKSNKSE